MRLAALFVGLFLVISSARAASPHVEHIPDFSLDPNAVIVEPGETVEINGLICVTTLLVHEGGKLILNPGTDLVFLDRSIDRHLDPEQIGNGLIVLGTLEVNGTPKTPFVRSTASISVGATTAKFSPSPEGWKVGDVLAIAGTRQRGFQEPYSSETEHVTITDVCGGAIHFTPTRYDHSTGTLEWMTPHVANLTRDVVIRSENPNGTRGHTMVMGHAKTWWSHCELRDLGRTDAMRYIDPSTNVNGRYPWHLHLMGDEGYRQYAQGMVVNGSRKWCATIHGTNDAIMVDCVGIGAIGGTFVTENGTERRNTIIGCLAMNARNGTQIAHDVVNVTGGQDFGREGSGFWFRGVGNFIESNVSADTDMGGFRYHGVRNTDFARPFPDDNGTFKNNEVYNTQEGIWFREPFGMIDSTGAKRVFVEDSKGWNLSRAGTYFYRSSGITVRNCTFWTQQTVNGGHSSFNSFVGTNSVGFRHDAAYQVNSVQYIDCQVFGFNYGTHLPPRMSPRGNVLYRNVLFNAHTAVVVPIVRESLSQYRLEDITIVPILEKRPGEPEADIYFKTVGTVDWPRPSDPNVWINGRRYFFPDEPGPDRVTVERVVGLAGMQSWD